MKSCSISSSPCSSAETVANNQDLLTEILLRLPAKPLFKFKCVSKQWLSRISDPKFCSYHIRHQRQTLNTTPTALLLNNGYTSTPQFQIVPLEAKPIKVPFLDYLNVPRIKIDQSCNGLLLCSSNYLLNPSDERWKDPMFEKVFEYCADYSSSVVSEDDRGHRFFVCNPTTKQFKRISHPVFKSHKPVVCLAFDPLKSPHYKVVCLHRLMNGERISLPMKKYEIDIYSSETESWSFKQHSFEKPPTMFFSDWVLYNGAIHWFLFDQGLLQFDVHSASMKLLPILPMHFMSNEMFMKYMGESRGRLHVGVGIRPSYSELDVWEMKLDYSGWFIKYHLNLDSLRMRFLEPHESRFSVLGLVRAEKEEESMLVLFANGRAMSYNLYDGTLNKLCDLLPSPIICEGDLDYERFHAYEYIETLTCV